MVNMSGTWFAKTCLVFLFASVIVARDSCPGRFEYFSCGGACDNVCATLHERNQTNCPIRNIQCNKQCYCETGFARDGNNVCVPFDECPKTSKSKRNSNEDFTCSGPHEVFTATRSCPPETCLSLVAKFKCDANQPSVPRCACMPGHLRLKEDSPCMPLEKCPQLANFRF